LEFARYVDEINDPFLRAYFDIGNSLVLWSYPHDWIRTLGQRIHRVHVKDWDSKKRRFVLPGDGEVDWAAVREALAAVDYEGFATAELPGGDAEYLKDLSSRMSAVLGA
jgi:hexulose-6-phosphate isomerase